MDTLYFNIKVFVYCCLSVGVNLCRAFCLPVFPFAWLVVWLMLVTEYLNASEWVSEWHAPKISIQPYSICMECVLLNIHMYMYSTKQQTEYIHIYINKSVLYIYTTINSICFCLHHYIQPSAIPAIHPFSHSFIHTSILTI